MLRPILFSFKFIAVPVGFIRAVLEILADRVPNCTQSGDALRDAGSTDEASTDAEPTDETVEIDLRDPVRTPPAPHS